MWEMTMKPRGSICTLGDMFRYSPSARNKNAEGYAATASKVSVSAGG